MKIWICASLLSVTGLPAGCTPLGLNTASTSVAREEPARPDVLGAFEGEPEARSVADWERRKPLVRKALEDYVYGPIPTELRGVEVARKVVDTDFAGVGATLENITVRVGESEDAPVFHIAIAYPKGASAANPAPLILNQNFSGNGTAFGSAALGDVVDPGSFQARMIRLIFGKYIMEGPNAQILERGFAYASVFPGEFAADQAEQAKVDLARFAALTPEGRAPSGVIAVWAAGFGWSLDVLDEDPRLDAGRTAVWGHSRHGKSALLAMAVDERIEAGFPLQSGKGGSTLTRSYAGESVKQITKSYPHWFAPAYAGYADREDAIPVDQHQLLAMVAPRPLLLGNGWKDVWSDPNGTFRAMLAADPVYELYGVEGLRQTGMRDEGERGALDFLIRQGGHGVRADDWDYYLNWLDRWLTPRPAAEPVREAPDAIEPEADADGLDLVSGPG